MDAVLVLDGHNDLPWAHRTRFGGDLDQADPAGPLPMLHTDIPRLRRGGVGGQFWSVYVPAELTGSDAVGVTLEQVDFVHRLVARNPETLELAGTADAVEAAMGRGRIASLLGAEGGHSIGESLAALRNLYRLGVRYLTLTHNRNVGWADAATDVPDVGGLSAFGRAVVAEMNRIGMLVDCSHTAEATAAAALAASRAPLIFSHSNCRALCDHPRNVTDGVLSGLVANRGVLMLTFVPAFVAPAAAGWQRELKEALARRGVPDDGEAAEGAEAAWVRSHPPPPVTVADVADHIDHAREVVGVDHVGIGGDFDGTSRLPIGLEDVSAYPRLWEELRGRGWSEADLRRLASGNVVRALRAAEEVARGLSGG